MHENEKSIGKHLIFILQRYARCLEVPHLNHINLNVPNSIGDSVKFLSQRIKESITVFKFTEEFYLFFVCLFVCAHQSICGRWRRSLQQLTEIK